MSHSLSITPADKKIDKAIRLFLAIIWIGLIIFGILTLIQPKWLRDISSMGRESEASDLKVQGDEFLKAGNLQFAITKYQLALETDPDMQSATGNLAIAYAKMGKLSEAENTIQKLVDKLPERAWVGYLNLGDIYRDRKDFEKARKFYLQSTENSPFPANGYMFAGFCSMQLQDWDSALLYYKKSLSAHTDYESLYRGSLLRDHYGYREDEAALKVIEEEMQKEDLNPELSRYDEQSFNIMVHRRKDIASIYNDVGIIYYQNGDNKQAETFFREALRLNPMHSKARTNLRLVTENQ